MKPYVCWKKEDAFKVINPDADALADAYFRAVHTDFKIRIKEGEVAQIRATTPDGLLGEILAQRDHAIVPIIGQAGTGKSHLIRWINLKLASAPDHRKVIYVPKAQTNLRDIVFLLVRSLPKAQQQPYLAALEGAGGSYLTPEAQRTAILNQLHVALVNDPGGTDRTIDLELERFALDGLKAMILDPHVRSALVADGTFAAQLAAHVFEQPERERYKPAEERREFKISDFPLGAGNLRRAASETQEFLGWLTTATQVDKGVVASILNRHLDWAIANCLNITGDRLITLMRDLRSHFRKTDTELFLLIEDFARLQGLDRALLQSIIEQRGDLCVLRTVFASTVGFFDSIAQTVRSRTQFVVDMDTASEDSNFTLDGFVARYLNASRWGTEELESQWASVQGGEISFDISSKCDKCMYRTDCHAAFGHVEGVGLYPLTSTAIRVMATRLDPQFKQHFNPRNFQRYVLRPIMDLAQSIETGQFPSVRLLESLGGRKMAEIDAQRIERLDPSSGKRRIVMLELWSGIPEVGNLDPRIHEAFSIPLLNNLGQLTPDLKRSEISNNRQATIIEEQVQDPRLAELEQWNQGRVKLSADTVNRLRPLLFKALLRYIDWDIAGLAPSLFLNNATGLMRQSQITFQNASVNPSANSFQLVIPSKDATAEERSRVTIALQALLEADAQKSWDIPAAILKMAYFQECLDQWSRDLMTRFRGIDTNAPNWNTGEEAFDLLAIMRVSLSTAEPPEGDAAIMRVALDDSPLGAPDFLSVDLNTALAKLYESRAMLRDIVTSRYSLTKGGDEGSFIDAARLLRSMKSLRKRKFLPSERSASFQLSDFDNRDPRKIAGIMREQLPAAFTREVAERTQLVGDIRESFGTKISEDLFASAVRKVSDIGGNWGVADTRELREAWAALQGNGLSSLKKLVDEHEPDGVDARLLRSGVGSCATMYRRLTKSLTTVLDKAEGEARARLNSAGVDPAEKTRLLEDVSESLKILADTLLEYSRDVAA